MIDTLLAAALAVSLFSNWRMYTKIAFYEKWYEAFAEQVTAIHQEIKRMDRIGAMEADDEVGYFFEALKEMMHNLYTMGFYENPPERATVTPPDQDRFFEFDPSDPGYVETPPVEGVEQEVERAGGAESA